MIRTSIILLAGLVAICALMTPTQIWADDLDDAWKNLQEARERYWKDIRREDERHWRRRQAHFRQLRRAQERYLREQKRSDGTGRIRRYRPHVPHRIVPDGGYYPSPGLPNYAAPGWENRYFNWYYEWR